ncbi:conserved hypothetical protein [Kribbella flavida DSM 17836]|uniref:Tat pathway signal sequence domain protein n=1 Tax=Kribbella flavida (strain DSM 17836 / JCM 10339 / NBRC 14399) TaxID=479435 RepID=D2PSH7_KRIFD|nr:hypothetical protein [Kribbella flavida]ADB33115.1 conserved hypothetical protein [Kribbella flavida DSM 17836]
MSPSRRTVLGSLVTLGTVIAAPTAATSATATPGRRRNAAASTAAAFEFLAEKIDQYGAGATLRVPQSYTGGYFAGINFVSSFLYDDALTVIALLQEGSAAQLARATMLGDVLLYVQANDPIGDGRTRASYQPNPLVTADGTPYIGSPAAYSGNQAWVGMALCHLYQRTGQRKYLTGALTAADWIQSRTWSAAGIPGYTGGRSADDQPLTFKASEHNIDIGAFFAMLHRQTGQRVWSARSAQAFAFVRAMWDGTARMIWTGTTPDGVTINRDPIPADVQTWAYLATKDARYGQAVDWTIANLTANDGGFTGISFSTTDTSKVWFEGTAQLVAALDLRQAPGDQARINAYLAGLRDAQRRAPNADGKGIVSASSDGLDTGFGDLYYAALHTGATAWYLLAATGANPFTL